MSEAEKKEQPSAEVVPDPLGAVEKGHVRIYLDFDTVGKSLVSTQFSFPPELCDNLVVLYGMCELYKERRGLASQQARAERSKSAIVPPSQGDVSRLLKGRH